MRRYPLDSLASTQRSYHVQLRSTAGDERYVMYRAETVQTVKRLAQRQCDLLTKQGRASWRVGSIA